MAASELMPAGGPKLVFWQFAGMVKSDGVRLRPLLWTFVAGYLGYTTIAWTYFFAAPAVVEMLIAVLLGMALVRLR